MTAVLYGARGTPDGNPGTSDLYLVDPATGALTSIGPIGYAMSGIAQHPISGDLYGLSDYADPVCPDSLILIDKSTGAGTVLGACNNGTDLGDCEFDAGGTLYADSQFIRRSYQIDLDGTYNTVGSYPGTLNPYAIARDSGGVFFVIFGGNLATAQLRTASPSTPSSSLVAATSGAPSFTQGMSASFDPTDVLYLIANDFGSNAYLCTVDTTTGVVTTIAALADPLISAIAWGTGTVPPPPPGPSRRFFSGYPWRFIVTDKNTQTITFLDRLATGRQVTVGRNIAREARGLVPSDNPEINILHTDGDPFLNEGNRLIYGFRREGWNGSVAPWVCRFAGPLLHLEDNAQTDAPATPWIAQDPWALLYRRPVRLSDGDLPGPDGRVFLAADLWTYQEIAYQLLLDSITYDGACHIDPTGGTIVSGPVIAADVTLQQGLSVGAAWDQLCATGKTDIELDPVYDPVGSPGVCCTFNAKPVIGTTKNAAVFAWDLPSRSLTDISRVIDGTGRANTIQYYFGQGGPPVSVQIDAASVAKYGEYWEQQFWPGFREAGPVTAMAARRLALVRDGVRTFTFAPAPERSPIPFDDYMPGDWAPFFASRKLRAKLGPTLVSGQWTNIPRIESFTVDIADNQTETVNPLLVSMDIQP